jgi:hypothetical protein
VSARRAVIAARTFTVARRSAPVPSRYPALILIDTSGALCRPRPTSQGAVPRTRCATAPTSAAGTNPLRRQSILMCSGFESALNFGRLVLESVNFSVSRRRRKIAILRWRRLNRFWAQAFVSLSGAAEQ